ncbi:hypothetical protein KX01_1476 [Francisella frigiditurris]|uniref:GST N-terminal domain-containing protein n=2 Tax=Francisella frigiditurris TaxID=1542390 RepID=A0A1J0KW54_9GAMM|nr:hypothetical protein KX01_1476 [Francisella frigiditurris]
MKMYIYNHCPYCIKTRLVADLSNLKYETVILANDDEKAHVDKIGSKQVPFIEKDDGEFLKESNDICEYISRLQNFNIATSQNNIELKNLISELQNISKKITYSRVPYHLNNKKDFPTQSAKNYFINKKSSYIGDMDELYKNPPKEIILEVQTLLDKIDKYINYPFINGDKFSWDDINIFPFLSLITIMKDLVKIPVNVEKYLKGIEEKTNIKLY